jgi:hypothetical protein
MMRQRHYSKDSDTSITTDANGRPIRFGVFPTPEAETLDELLTLARVARADRRGRGRRHHVYGSSAFASSASTVVPATYTDHDYLRVDTRLRPAPER